MSTTTEPTHKLLRAIGAIPSGYRGVAVETASEGRGPKVGPDRENNIDALHRQYPYRFIPEAALQFGSEPRKTAVTFARESGGILVAAHEVKELG